MLKVWAIGSPHQESIQKLTSAPSPMSQVVLSCIVWNFALVLLHIEEDM